MPCRRRPTRSNATPRTYERKYRERQAKQFQRLKDEAKALFGMVDGRPGVTNPAKWDEFLERAGDDIGNGRFIVRQLGAERYLDAETVAVLITFRQNLIAELENPTAADIMMIDTALVGYYNFVRVQGWIGNASLTFEGKLFGREPPVEDSGFTVDLIGQLERLRETMLPLLEKSQRMMMRGLGGLSRRKPRRQARMPIAMPTTVGRRTQEADDEPEVGVSEVAFGRWRPPDAARPRACAPSPRRTAPRHSARRRGPGSAPPSFAGPGSAQARTPR